MFVLCGEALWDLFVTGGVPPRIEARTGGSPFNAAVGLARLGQDAALLAGISTDALGERLVEALRREGVATDLLVRSARPTTLSLIDIGPGGAPTYSIHGHDAADRAVAEAELPALGPEVWGVHAGSFAMVVEPVGSALLALFRREAGRRLLTLDPNVRLGVEPDAALWRARLAAFLRLADIVKASREDIDQLYPGEDAAAVAARWLTAGPALIIVTDGAAGALAFSATGRVAVPAVRTPVVDTVGAGDAFLAALVAWLAERDVRDRGALNTLDDHALESLLGFGNAAAAIACSRRGADMARRAELA